jgi:type 1 glutamine amidotransferase
MSYKHWLVAFGMWFGLAVVAWAAPPYKALIVDGQNVSAHPWAETTPVMKKLLEETKLFTVDVATSPPKGSTEMGKFKPDFAAYSVVVTNYQGDPWPEETLKALVDYVKNGGGLVVYHFACAAFPKSKDYTEMIGVGWARTAEDGPYWRWKDGKIVRDERAGRGGGHGPMQPFQLVVREPNHPITAGLPEAFMHVPDELYGWLRGPGKNMTVLATAFAPADKGGADEHEPLLFTVQYGKGRVFQHALGHTAKELRSVAFIVPFQRGAEWAASGKVTQKVPADFPTADKASVRE